MAHRGGCDRDCVSVLEMSRLFDLRLLRVTYSPLVQYMSIMRLGLLRNLLLILPCFGFLSLPDYEPVKRDTLLSTYQ